MNSAPAVSAPAIPSGVTPVGSQFLPVLLPGVPVLARADAAVHVGCDPHSAVVLRPAPGVDVRAVADVLQRLRSPITYRAVSRKVRASGLDARTFRSMLDRLVAAGKATSTRRCARMCIDVHGHGDVAAALTASLRSSGHDVRNVRADHHRLRPRPGTLAVIADQPIADPVVTAYLMESRLPHVSAYLRDGIGVVGPLVLPGSSSCLRCVDLHRTDLDPQWPVLAAQLSGVAGYASPAVLRATIAIAHAQIDDIAAKLPGPTPISPTAVGRMFEFRESPARLDSLDIPVHPRCGCLADGYQLSHSSPRSTILGGGERTP
ncbi:hypothetical protein [Gordonia zhaorongruii]|uniref:hypothetical protein n=1 Tax=Gordonia zhaorongruii TaxID=2597659 RepID=UPI00117D09CE|nr:hypothetical protein [Gordonia zhaorongruii]